MKFIQTNSTYSLGSTYEKTIKIKQPKLVSIPGFLPPSQFKFIETQNLTNIEESKKIEEQNRILKEKLSIANKEKAKKETEPKKKSQMEKNLLKYYENPHVYMDFLLEKVFQDRYIHSKSDAEMKEKIRLDFEKMFENLAKKFGDFAKKQKFYLKNLEDEIDKRLKIKRNKQLLDPNAEFQTEPLYECENIVDIFQDEGRDRFNVIINSKQNLPHDITNEPDSKFHSDIIAEKALSCLKLNKIECPQKEFLVVNEKKLAHNEIYDYRKQFDLERSKTKNEEDYISNIVNNYEKTAAQQKKIFDDLYNRNVKIEDKMKQINDRNFEFLLYLKSKMEENKMFDNLTITNLRLLGFSMDEIRKLVLSKDNNYFAGCLDEEEKIKQRIKDNEDFNMKCKEKLYELYSEFRPKERKITDNDIEKLYDDKYKSKEIGKRIYYNDNPYHYGYRYTGSSINIKKKLNKVYNNDGNILKQRKSKSKNKKK